MQEKRELRKDKYIDEVKERKFGLNSYSQPRQEESSCVGYA